MFPRTLLPTLNSLRRPGQLVTRTYLTAAFQVKRPSAILQMFSPSRTWNATHHGSRGRASFNQPRPPRSGFWQQISQRINKIPSNIIFWGIFGINGAVFLLWQVANAQWVSCDSPFTQEVHISSTTYQQQSRDPSLSFFMLRHFTSSKWNLQEGRMYVTLLEPCLCTIEFTTSFTAGPS